MSAFSSVSAVVYQNTPLSAFYISIPRLNSPLLICAGYLEMYAF